jgi:hypothetical protein
MLFFEDNLIALNCNQRLLEMTKVTRKNIVCLVM